MNRTRVNVDDLDPNAPNLCLCADCCARSPGRAALRDKRMRAVRRIVAIGKASKFAPGVRARALAAGVVL